MLKRLFIKNYKNINNKEIRNKYGIVAGLFGVISNAIIAVIKLIIGFISNSMSICIEGINNLFDTSNSIITLVGFKLSNKKSDSHHPYGYARSEYICGLVICIIMIITSILFLKESLMKIIYPEDINISTLTIILLIISLFIKLIQYLEYKDLAYHSKSETINSNRLETRNDIITSSCVLISIIIMKIYSINLDGYLAFIVSLYITYSSIHAFIASIDPLLGSKPSKEYITKIKKKILSYDNIIGCHDIVIHNYGFNNNFLTVDVEIDSKLDLLEAHDIVDIIENDFQNDLNLNTTIHIDPVIVGNKKVDLLKAKVINELHAYDSELVINDFRVVKGKRHLNVLFDVLVPHNKNYRNEEIESYLRSKIKQGDKDYHFQIHIDRPYC